jgi:hypothetical protein
VPAVCLLVSDHLFSLRRVVKTASRGCRYDQTVATSFTDYILSVADTDILHGNTGVRCGGLSAVNVGARVGG